MNLRVSGKNLDLGESLRNRVSARIEDAVAKYFNGGWSGHVTVGPEGAGFRAECVLHLDSGVDLQAQGEAHDPIASCDEVADRIEKRLRRYKRRLKDHRSEQKSSPPEPASLVTDYVLSAPDHEADMEESWNPAVIAESTSSLVQMTVRDAVLQLDFTGAHALLYRHASHALENRVIRRADRHNAWRDPPSTTG
jgi:ribosomal subunit interface protein